MGVEVGASVGVAVDDGASVGVAVGVAVGGGVSVGVAVGGGVSVGVAVGGGTSVGVAMGGGTSVGVALRVAVGSDASVSVAAGGSVIVRVGVGPSDRVVSRTFVTRTSEMMTSGVDAAVGINPSAEAINQSAITADKSASRLDDSFVMTLFLAGCAAVGRGAPGEKGCPLRTGCSGIRSGAGANRAPLLRRRTKSRGNQSALRGR